MNRATANAIWEKLRAEFLAPRETRTPSAWAREERWIAQGQSPLSQHGDIRFDPGLMPWVIEPMDDAVNPDVQTTVLWWASGMGKTEGVAASVLGWSVHESPSNIFCVMPKQESRDKFSRDVIERTIEASPALKQLFVERKSRDTGRTIGYKRFAGGSMFLTSAGSASNFRGPRARVIYLGECDGYPSDIDGEGDPVFLAWRRAEGFANAIKIIEGTGTFAQTTGEDGKTIYNSRIHYWFEQGDQRKWHVPCRKCGHLQFIRFDQIRFPAGKPEKAALFCEKCDAEHNDKQRVDAIMAGKWIATAPFHGIRSYWLNGFNATLPAEKGFKSKLHQFVVDAERAAKDPAARKVWINTVQCGLTAPDTEGEAAPDWQMLIDRCEDYEIVPEGALVMTCGIDVHPDRIELGIGAYGERDECWQIEHIVFPGDIHETYVWKDLEAALNQEYEHEGGSMIDLSFGLIDAGHSPESVYWFLKWIRESGSPVAGKLRACRGSHIFPHPVIDLKYSRLAKQLKGHWIGPDACKDAIYSALRRKPHEDGTFPAGYRHYNHECDELFFGQLCAERVTSRIERGIEIRRYINPDRLRNEALDCSVMGYAAFKLRRWDMPARREALERGMALA